MHPMQLLAGFEGTNPSSDFIAHASLPGTVTQKPLGCPVEVDGP